MLQMRVGFLTIIGAVMLATGQVPTAAAPARSATIAPIVNAHLHNIVPGRYIVAFKPGTSGAVIMQVKRRVASLGARIGYTYPAPLGFSVTMPHDASRSNRAMQLLRRSPAVAYVEAEQRIFLQQPFTVQPPTPAGAPGDGQDRIDRRLLPLDGTYRYTDTAPNVNVFVVDTGIRLNHVEFGGRVLGGWTAFSDSYGYGDCHGHGTAVAGIIGGARYGIAKQVKLYSVRAFGCNGSSLEADVIAGLTWISQSIAFSSITRPAVANMSFGSPALSPSLDSAVQQVINLGVTVVVAAGNSNADACTSSPADVSDAITVGSMVPGLDMRAYWYSNYGPCVDLFAPGEGIATAWWTSPFQYTASFGGTSAAAPHVAGVAALHLQTHQYEWPWQVWSRIDLDADLNGTTPGWNGLGNLGPGSPDKLLHWGALGDGYSDGEPHIRTVDGLHYDLQTTGEFVTLRDNDMQIQTRQEAVPTAQRVPRNGYMRYAGCVSINTAVAARVGTHRVTYEPDWSGDPSATGLRVLVDGVATALPQQGVTLGNNARVSPLNPGVKIEFPNDTLLHVVPNFWPAQNTWYLTLRAYHTRASEGTMGLVPTGSWLPALPNGASVGTVPGTAHQRYITLNHTFADAWRVSSATTLFDYAPGQSTNTFTIPGWPLESEACRVRGRPEADPLIHRNRAAQACAAVPEKNDNANCAYDVRLTGEPGFANLYRTVHRVEAGETQTVVYDDKDRSKMGVPVTFTALVSRTAPTGARVAAGTVRFAVDGKPMAGPIKLDVSGRAVWRSAGLDVGKHGVAATFVPAPGSPLLASSSFAKLHGVTR